MIPAQNPKEHDFYTKGVIAQFYEKDTDKNFEQKFEGDPLVGFHELQLFFCRLALEVNPKDENMKKDIEKVVYQFLHEQMSLRTNSEIESGKLLHNHKKVTSLISRYKDQINTLDTQMK